VQSHGLTGAYGKQQGLDDSAIRAAAASAGAPCITTRAGLSAVVSALTAIHWSDYQVRSILEHLAMHPRPAAAAQR
jgi:carbamoyl-phosphate synthase large subunit